MKEKLIRESEERKCWKWRQSFPYNGSLAMQREFKVWVLLSRIEFRSMKTKYSFWRRNRGGFPMKFFLVLRKPIHGTFGVLDWFRKFSLLLFDFSYYCSFSIGTHAAEIHQVRHSFTSNNMWQIEIATAIPKIEAAYFRKDSGGVFRALY